jgi:hypothetical protein
MRAQTVTVGPLATASANNICTSQTPSGANQLAINGALATNFAVFTASISGNAMTVTAVTSGVIQIGQAISGLGVASGTVVTGPPPGPGQTTTVGGAGTYTVSVAQTVNSTTLYANAVATLDTPRRVQLTTAGADAGKTMTITGTDWNGSTITEVLTAVSGGTSYTNLDFKTVTSIVSSATFAGAVTVGTNGIASSAWVRLDEYTPFPTAIQVSVTTAMGAAQTYTVQQTLQDPNSATNAVLPYQLVWINTVDTNVVAASTSQQSSYTYAPSLARVTLNYNAPTAATTGAVSAMFIQNASPSF